MVAMVFTITYAALGSIDGVLIFAFTLPFGLIIVGIIGICYFSQRFNVLVEGGMEDTCEYLNNMKGVAFQCKKRKEEVGSSSESVTQESIYIEGMCLSSLSVMPHILRFTFEILFDPYVLTNFRNFYFWVYFYAVRAIPMSYSGSQMQPVMVKISDDGLTISRTMPTMLSDQMSIIHWTSFREEVDAALKPVALMNKLSYWRKISGVGGLALFVLVIALSAAVGIPYWTIFVVGVIGGVLEYYLEKQYKENRTLIVTALTEVCNRANEKYPEVTFKVSEDVKVMRSYELCSSDKNKPDGYIEVTKYKYNTVTSTTSTDTRVTHHPINTTSDDTAANGSATNTAEPPAPQKRVEEDDIEAGFGLGTKGKKSREERLEELDGMKDQLSEDEYYGKRAEIQSDV